jgi:hypothetical protein
MTALVTEAVEKRACEASDATCFPAVTVDGGGQLIGACGLSAAIRT